MQILCNENSMIFRQYKQGFVFNGKSYALSINRDYYLGQMIHSEMFLQVCLSFTTVPAEVTFVLVFFMMQLVLDDGWAVILDGGVVACSDHPVRRVLAEGDCKKY